MASIKGTMLVNIDTMVLDNLDRVRSVYKMEDTNIKKCLFVILGDYTCDLFAYIILRDKILNM